MEVFIGSIVRALEQIAPVSLQENYDNAGLIVGDANTPCTGILVSLDATEQVILEAAQKGCNLVVAHHPIVFGGLKKINGSNYVERAVIAAIRNNIAIYAIHTNLDNVLHGVNAEIAKRLGLVNCVTLKPKQQQLKKLVTFVPIANANAVRTAIFSAGAGHIGQYSECSFNSSGEGTFKAAEGANPYTGIVGLQHTEQEVRIETIFAAWQQAEIIQSLLAAHPYEEVAYDIYPVENQYKKAGSGMIGNLEQPQEEQQFLQEVAGIFGTGVIRHTRLLGKKIRTVAICGGAGSFLTQQAIHAGADIYLTSDIKYHEFFDAEEKIVLADIGHYESEQYTIDLLFGILKEKFTTFATLKTGINTNPVQYFTQKA
ncbi:MAG TPA: Nif3-like dinuclear metal center hexameric protein [Ferruginibacter sp.]|nr:Nif3-like dinuclear metal center hexameric protein [Ferruginibacter sp.]HMP21368.1 Nif3-like dinuclear metal center hexameric protein [Ferruginibacter sp.]